MASKIDHSRFIELLSVRFPEVYADIDDNSSGLLHPEVGTLARATQRAIDAGETDQVIAYFKFVDEIFTKAAPDVENAIYVSYLENLNFGGRNHYRTSARKLLPTRLSRALRELEEYLDMLFKAGEDADT